MLVSWTQVSSSISCIKCDHELHALHSTARFELSALACEHLYKPGLLVMLARQTVGGFEVIVLKRKQIEEKAVEQSSNSVTQGKGCVIQTGLTM